MHCFRVRRSDHVRLRLIHQFLYLGQAAAVVSARYLKVALALPGAKPLLPTALPELRSRQNPLRWRTEAKAHWLSAATSWTGRSFCKTLFFLWDRGALVPGCQHYRVLPLHHFVRSCWPDVCTRKRRRYTLSFRAERNREAAVLIARPTSNNLAVAALLSEVDDRDSRNLST